jgi:NDP-sugar pyrophosphorylase family protein
MKSMGETLMNKDIFVNENTSIKEALKKLDKSAEKILLVVDEEKRLLGTLTDGDIRRYIIKTGKLSGIVKNIYNKNPIVVQENSLSEKKIKEIFLEKKIEVLPVVDENNKVVDYLTWNQVFSEKEKPRIYKGKEINVPVVIMAGGKGTRLSPFTKVLPKPLIPVGEKTIIEHIIDRFYRFGVRKFYITLNYKGEMIEAYFKGLEKDYEVEFIREERFLGTAGSLKLLEDKLEKDEFFVSNCDILVDADYSEILDFHRSSGSIFTSVTAIRHYRIPYGVVLTSNGGIIDKIVEKPEYTFQINTGVYLLNKNVLELIPQGFPFDMPELINTLLERGEKVSAYPVSEGAYIDTGEWKEYRMALKKLSLEE